MNNKITFGIGGIVIGLLLTSIFTSSMFSGSHNSNNGMMDGNNQNTGNNQMMGNIDQHFIEQMIPHHESAVEMAQMALEKAKRPEIKTLATNIIKDQNKEIGDMTSWYKDWFKKNVSKTSDGMMGGGMHGGMQDEMTALENAPDFDKAFIEAMIPHHQSAIMMAQMLQSGTNRPEMTQLAKNIIESQSKEIQQMQGWYTAWYK